MSDEVNLHSMSLLQQLDHVRAHPKENAGKGSFGEAAAAVFPNTVMGHEIVADEATRDKPQGIDLVTFDPETGKIATVEVKTTGRLRSRGPRLSKTKTTTQNSRAWLADGSTSPSGRSRTAEAGWTSS